MDHQAAADVSAAEDIRNSTDQTDGADDAEIEKQYLDPSRWWFASTACPLIAGTFGPMANAFNICALGSYWREGSDGNKLGTSSIPDPHWLTAVNAVSLACSLTANACLLYNMANKSRFEIAQPIIIVGFFLASVLLIGPIGAASSNSFLGPDPSRAHAQAYYYAIWAAAIYMILAALMTLTVWGALKGKYEKQFHLTAAQRTLMLQTITFMVYLLVGALVFSHVEHWSYLDAVYWADFTLLTVGLGEPLVPRSTLGRALLMPYAIGGIVTLGLTVASIRSMLLSTGRAKFRARTAEKLRTRAHSVVAPRPIPGPSALHDTPPNPADRGTTRSQRARDFATMRAIQRRATARNKHAALAASTAVAAALWLGGGAAFAAAEHWPFFDALYFAHTSLLTIGYGDLAPSSPAGRAAYVAWSLLAVPALTLLVAGAADALAALTLPRRRKPSSEMELDERTPAQMLRARLTPAEQAHARASFLGCDRRFHAWLLAREAAALAAGPRARTFAYAEWAYFLALVGCDEGRPVLRAELGRRRHEAGRRAGRGLGYGAGHGLGSGVEGGHGLGYGPEGGHAFAVDDGPLGGSWSWAGARSPLLAGDEGGWLLGLVLGALGQVLGREGGDDGGGCPVSVSMLVGDDCVDHQ